MRTIAAITKGDWKVPVRFTSSLLTMPAEVATKPFSSVARAMIVDRSDCDSETDVAEEMSHASNVENRIAVEIPPKMRPKRRNGYKLTSLQRQAVA